MVYTFTTKPEVLCNDIIHSFPCMKLEKVWVYFQIPDDVDKMTCISYLLVSGLEERFFFLTFAPDSYLLYLPFKIPTLLLYLRY